MIPINYIIKRAFLGMAQNRYLSILNIITITVALFITGFIALLLVNANKYTDIMSSHLFLTAFLKENINEKQKDMFIDNLNKWKEIRETRYISKEDGLNMLNKALGRDEKILGDIQKDNPLPEAIEIKLHKEFNNLRSIDLLAERLRQEKIVDEVRYSRQWAKQFFRLLNGIRTICFFLVIFICLSTVIIVSNTIRLALYARKKELEILSIVGATTTFIRLPYIIEGLFHGIIGGIFSASALYGCFSAIFINTYFKEDFYFINWEFYPFHTTIAMLSIGIILGGAGSVISIKKYIN